MSKYYMQYKKHLKHFIRAILFIKLREREKNNARNVFSGLWNVENF